MFNFHNSPSPYKPVDNIILNCCGFSDNSTTLDGRTWNGDVNSKFFPQELSQNQASLATNSSHKTRPSQVPYTTACLSVSPFTYKFPLKTGQKFVQLYFYPATYSNFDRSNALFSVETGTFTLLRDFNASLTVDADGDPGDTIFRDTPSDYYNRFPLIGEEYMFNVDNRTALETIYRINLESGQKVQFTKQPAYTAPENLYRTAWTMGTNKTINKSYNLTWEFPVHSGSVYLVRLHFCEFQPEIIAMHDRVFLIFIANQIAETAADVMNWAGSNGVPIYKDYAVSMFGEENQKKMNLSIALQANLDDHSTHFTDAILNGIEIFKVSDFSGNLAGPNPEPVPLTPPKSLPPIQSTESKKNNRTTIIAVGGGVSGFSILLILVVLIFRLAERVKNFDNSTKASGSTLPCSLSCYFSLAEIIAATNNFDKVFIIGAGEFGDVYKGYINGAEEFKTVIAMLSRLRHRHLVSLIGYCEDGNEMILYQPLSWKQRLQICIGAAHGLSYLHTGATYTIIHRDMKSTNVLLDEQWLAMVSDFGLPKFGPIISKSHVSTVVKGTFGYLDPEYYCFQRLTKKSDVYSYGVVLCEVLCGKPPIIRTDKEKPMGLVAWVLQCYRNGKLDQIVNPSLKGEIELECLKKFGEIVENCLLDNGTKRPSMNDVVGGLELTLELQESAEKDVKLDLAEEIDLNDDDEHALIPICTSIEQTLFKQFVIGDEVLALVHLFLLKMLLCMCTFGFCDQPSS
ncbi:hypothetical protein RGQ29_011795 [Quercus rubra]|uniref:Protein kinase domain-containing protein n=1 Tax=Quercus rubra TaxID=3512 RepID=A0AAN7J899_QUERU|nr:hypothetical protein RGQ29_011795 [Quercus rubra]